MARGGLPNWRDDGMDNRALLSGRDCARAWLWVG